MLCSDNWILAQFGSDLFGELKYWNTNFMEVFESRFVARARGSATATKTGQVGGTREAASSSGTHLHFRRQLLFCNSIYLHFIS